jgi:hypothetical protein
MQESDWLKRLLVACHDAQRRLEQDRSPMLRCLEGDIRELCARLEAKLAEAELAET